jgi:hypothetical protein
MAWEIFKVLVYVLLWVGVIVCAFIGNYQLAILNALIIVINHLESICKALEAK